MAVRRSRSRRLHSKKAKLDNENVSLHRGGSGGNVFLFVVARLVVYFQDQLPIVAYLIDMLTIRG